MKKQTWFLLAFFALLAVALRVLEVRTGFDADGLPVASAAGLLLPAALLLAAAVFFFGARTLPPRGALTGGFVEHFLFGDTLGVTCGVAGAFLVLIASALSFLADGAELLTALFALLGAAAAAVVLYVILMLRRGGDFPGLLLLVPVCFLTLRLIYLYRTDVVDPVLRHTYVELLAIAALTCASLSRSAFAFLSGAPRTCVPLSAMAVILSLAAAVGGKGLSYSLFFVGFALVELAFLSAADFEE